MNDNVVWLPTTLDIPPDRVLQEAIMDPSLDTVVVIGKTQEGRLYLASSTGNGGEISLLIRRAEHFLIHWLIEQCGDA